MFTYSYVCHDNAHAPHNTQTREVLAYKYGKYMNINVDM